MDQGLKKRIEGFGVGVKCSYSQECGLNLTCVEGECRCMEVDKGGCDWTPDASQKARDFVSNSRRHKGLNVKKINGNEHDKVFTLFNDDERLQVPPGASCSNGEQCSGGSVCSTGGWCACPHISMAIVHGVCVKQDKTAGLPTNKNPFYAAEPHHSYQNNDQAMMVTKAPASVETSTIKLSAPGTHCGPVDICVGGSSCVEGLCLCPAGTRPSPKIGNCVMYNQKSIETSSFALPTTASTGGLGVTKSQHPYVADMLAPQSPVPTKKYAQEVRYAKTKRKQNPLMAPVNSNNGTPKAKIRHTAKEPVPTTYQASSSTPILWLYKIEEDHPVYQWFTIIEVEYGSKVIDPVRTATSQFSFPTKLTSGDTALKVEGMSIFVCPRKSQDRSLMSRDRSSVSRIYTPYAGPFRYKDTSKMRDDELKKYNLEKCLKRPENHEDSKNRIF
uniref:EB domain-containing protein n=1 Tax=Ditylenchus dipsaci TaxID=166011 RepID=A0A915DFU3_9BILA